MRYNSTHDITLRRRKALKRAGERRSSRHQTDTRAHLKRAICTCSKPARGGGESSELDRIPRPDSAKRRGRPLSRFAFSFADGISAPRGFWHEKERRMTAGRMVTQTVFVLQLSKADKNILYYESILLNIDIYYRVFCRGIDKHYHS